MATPITNPDGVLRRLAYRPPGLHESTININIKSPSRTASIDLSERPISFGAIAKLPVEIQHTILQTLDAETLFNIEKVSAHGYNVVHSLPAFSELLLYAPFIFPALKCTGLLGLHSIAELQTALRSERCGCCPAFGPYLFLPTCTRHCWTCMERNPSIRAIPSMEVKRYFGLNDWHLSQLPAMHAVPGRYCFAGYIDESTPLYSTVAAKELGIAVHGSEAELANNLEKRLKMYRLRITGRFYQGASSTPFGEDPLIVQDQGNIPANTHIGLSSIPFPSLRPPDTAENGIWCDGCKLVSELDRFGKLDPSAMEGKIPRQDNRRYLLGMSRRAMTKERFLEHVKDCYGAQRMLEDPELKSQVV